MAAKAPTLRGPKIELGPLGTVGALPVGAGIGVPVGTLGEALGEGTPKVGAEGVAEGAEGAEEDEGEPAGELVGAAGLFEGLLGVLDGTALGEGVTGEDTGLGWLRGMMRTGEGDTGEVVGGGLVAALKSTVKALPEEVEQSQVTLEESVCVVHPSVVQV